MSPMDPNPVPVMVSSWPTVPTVHPAPRRELLRRGFTVGLKDPGRVSFPCEKDSDHRSARTVAETRDARRAPFSSQRFLQFAPARVRGRSTRSSEARDLPSASCWRQSTGGAVTRPGRASAVRLGVAVWLQRGGGGPCLP